MLLAILAASLVFAVVVEPAKIIFAAGFPMMKELKSVPRITKEELRPTLGNPNLIILDVRTNWHWKGSKTKILGAFCESPIKDIKSWAHKYPKEKTIVLY